MSATGWGNPSTGVVWDNQQPSNNPIKSVYVLFPSRKFLFPMLIVFRTPWTELKPSSSPTASKVSNEPPKESFVNNRTQDALSKWTQNQFKDNTNDIDGKTRMIISTIVFSSPFKSQPWFNY